MKQYPDSRLNQLSKCMFGRPLDCWQSVFLSKFQQRLYKETLFSPKGEWDETWARYAREEKQTADSSHIFEDTHTFQNNLIN